VATTLLYYTYSFFINFFSTLNEIIHRRTFLKNFSYFLLFIICFSSFNCTKLHATSETQTTTLDIAKKSEYIVLAQCTSSESKWNEQGTFIFTYTTFSINESIEGNSLEEEITLRYLGGQVDNIIQALPGLPEFNEGEEVILFLGSKNKYGYHNLKSIMSGVLRIQIDETSGQRFVSTKTTGIELYNKNTNKTLKTQTQERVTLQNFIFSLKKAIN